MTGTCPECGEAYERLGLHWRYSPEHRPQFTDKQKEIIIGLMMGDGTLNRSYKNPFIKVKMISPNYLEYIDSMFGCLGTGVNMKMTAKENARKTRESGFRPNAKAKNYSDMYRWNSRSHPELHDFNWYKTGKKVWPKDIELTPTVLKHWYCGDGCWNNNGSNNCIEISMSNEVENTEKVSQYFERVNLPPPSNYNIMERRSGGMQCKARFTVEDSKELWEYMGDPLPDFEYKWPEEYKS